MYCKFHTLARTGWQLYRCSMYIVATAAEFTKNVQILLLNHVPSKHEARDSKSWRIFDSATVKANNPFLLKRDLFGKWHKFFPWSCVRLQSIVGFFVQMKNDWKGQSVPDNKPRLPSLPTATVPVNHSIIEYCLNRSCLLHKMGIMALGMGV